MSGKNNLREKIAFLSLAGIILTLIIGFLFGENKTSYKNEPVINDEYELTRYKEQHQESSADYSGGGDSSSSISDAEIEESLKNLSKAMEDPDKVRLMECMGVQVYKEVPDGWVPPTDGECDSLKEKLGAVGGAREADTSQDHINGNQTVDQKNQSARRQ